MKPSKICTRCKKTCPLSSFHKDTNKKDGLHFECKVCAGVNPKTVFFDEIKKDLKEKLGGKNSGPTLKAYKKEGFYEKHKHLYVNQLITYEDAPSGKAYIGAAKRPLMVNKTGFGFQGVILQDEDRKIVQCSGCGKWVRLLTTSHTMKCSKMSIGEYKKKFGLNDSTGVVSDETSLELTKNALLNKSSTKSSWTSTTRPTYHGGLNKLWNTKTNMGPALCN